ncbi:hypothetical protein NE237_003529 [Protea cynaroides]|uniref:J domain-containing protein n=1 Tax=Protea cynaroides TaxID=273540 RepID=A0A9Q0KH96_9MAGN|nr:hypothetical protein NE237_003529 [Protea cynaroides]
MRSGPTRQKVVLASQTATIAASGSSEVSAVLRSRPMQLDVHAVKSSANPDPGIRVSVGLADPVARLSSGGQEPGIGNLSSIEMAKKKKSRVSEENKEHLNQQDLSQSPTKEKSLYEILGVERRASHQEIKKAYYKLALRLHPDKNPDDKEAKEKFQQLQKVMSILGDEEKRALYDQTGYIDDADLVGGVAQNLHEYFRTVYKKVTEADIEEFEANYRGSDSELKDLKDLYQKYKGNMNRLFCSMLCSDPKLDSHRFMDILDKAIAAGELKETKAYRKWVQKVSEAQPPTSPLKRRRKSKKGSDADLYAIISRRRSQREEQFESMFSSLAAKYNGGRLNPEPSEEEFEAAWKRIESCKPAKKARKK